MVLFGKSLVTVIVVGLFSSILFVDELRFLLGKLIGNLEKSHVVIRGSFCIGNWI